ncbi:MAG: hypothetical protein JHC93_08045 [Parachlamydiales bacterium]|nr:hypothetical protein [Parachlamydiales bacterium]
MPPISETKLDKEMYLTIYWRKLGMERGSPLAQQERFESLPAIWKTEHFNLRHTY